MRKFLFSTVFITLVLVLFTSCVSENYSNGERIGLVTQFSQTGRMYKSWEGELHVTQTGMNSTMHDFDFSIDNDHADQNIINQIDSAAQHGWKVKLTYHETTGKNWFSNRGETDYFITAVEVLDKNMSRSSSASNGLGIMPGTASGTIDTIYVVIVPKPKS